MGKRGWWSQLQSDEYPETITNYGDAAAANWRPEAYEYPKGEIVEPLQLTEKCPNCGHTYWTDKNCNNCGYPDINSPLADKKFAESARSLNRPIIKRPSQKYSKEELLLIRKHIRFYKALDSGDRIPDTEAQKHFVEVCRRRKTPETAHEKAYIKYLKNNRK